MRNLKTRVQSKRIANRWDEKVLHVPADYAVIIVAVIELANAGAIFFGVGILVWLLLAVVFA